jgi:hypothetical protein
VSIKSHYYLAFAKFFLWFDVAKGLSKDGCKAGAVAVLYVSVRSARQVVATLHQQKIEGGLIWARQLGGEVC